MARKLKIAGGILNVRLHPHPARTYANFIEALYRLKQPIGLRGDRYGMISLLNRSEEESGIYTGIVTTFTRIDTSEPWFDAANLKEATENQISRISIPDNLYPNAASFYFLFNTKEHRLYIQTYSAGRTFSINSAQRLFVGLSEDLSIIRDFGEAKITVVQSRMGLNTVFSLPVIKRIIITIEKPNADIFDDDFDENVEKFLEELNSKRMTLVLEAEAGKSIKPNQPLRRVGESALEHGSVRAEGRDAQGATERSTTDYPRPLHDKYDPDETSEEAAFRRLTGNP